MYNKGLISVWHRSRPCSAPTDQDVLRWFILVDALLLDPAAVLLLLAASRR
jgi:hypothetical protein